MRRWKKLLIWGLFTAWISSRKSAIENEKPDFEGEKLAIEGEKTSSGHQKVAIERINKNSHPIPDENGDSWYSKTQKFKKHPLNRYFCVIIRICGRKKACER